jgi:hypothetical protein
MQRVVLRDVDLASLESAVSASSYAKGVAYALQGAVLQMVWVSSQHALCGVVRGTNGESSTPAVYFRQPDGPDGRFEVERSQCSCLNHGCAHAVALVLTASDETSRPGAAKAPARDDAEHGSAQYSTAGERETSAAADERWRQVQAAAERVLQREAQTRETEREAAERARLVTQRAREARAAAASSSTARLRAAARWDRSLENLLGGAGTGENGTGNGARLGARGPGRSAADAPLVPLAIELTLAPSHPDDAGLRVMARLVLPGRSGGWVGGSLSWNKLDTYGFYGNYRPGHVRLLREMLALYRFGGDEPYYYTHGDERSIDLATFPSSRLWPLLDEAEAVGVQFVHKRGPGMVRRYREAEFCLDITRDTDETLVIDPVIRNGETGGVPVAFVGPDGHGVVCVSRHDATSGTDPASWPFWLARLTRPAPAQFQDMALAQAHLTLPADQQHRLRDEFYPRLRRAATVISSDGSFEPPVISAPTLVLNAAYGDGHDLDVSWEWSYQVGDTSHRAALDAPDAGGFRDLDAEQAILSQLPAGSQRNASLAGLDTMRFTTELLPLIAANDGIEVDVSGDAADYREASDSLEIGVSADEIAGDNDWFDLGITVSVEGNHVPFLSMFTALSRGETHMLLADGAYFSLEKPELQALRKLIEEAKALQETDGSLKISRFQAGLWEELAQLGVISRQASAWQRQVQGLLEIGGVEPPQPPPTLRATLRPYQLEGFGWLAFLWQHSLGGILADDMGLGKTLEALALISHARLTEPQAAPFLIVAPTSVVSNWAAEAARFNPGLRVQTIGKRGTPLDAGADAIVTSYALLRLDFDEYSAASWSGMILDEAQYAKNHQSKIYQCARRLTAPFKVAITGTPMENNLMELWSLLSITAPGLFPNPERFKEFYAKPIERFGDAPLLAQLRRRIRPLMKRRTKEQVAADLPAKQEQVVEVELHPRHRRIYQTYLQRERQKVLGLIGDMNAHRFTILRSLTLLRQLSLHAGLVDAEHADLPCAKIDTLIEQIQDVAAGGHRALVFSQFTSFLRLVRSRLEAAGVECCYLDGSTTDRPAVISSFKAGAAPVFLISLKAGGFGLNLTEADYCFLLDPWWNPATEAQAIDRTHRIGQTKNVMVYRLIASGTIEEKVMALKARKAELFSNVIDEGNAFGGSLSADDIRGLFA